MVLTTGRCVITYEEALALQRGLKIPWRGATRDTKIKLHTRLLGLGLFAKPEMPDNLVIYLQADYTPCGQTYRGVDDGDLYSASAALIPISALPKMEADNDC